MPPRQMQEGQEGEEGEEGEVTTVGLASKLKGVSWLSKNTIVAALRVERTLSTHSGPFRMSDPYTVQRNMNISLYLAASDGSRIKVPAEVNRPIFFRL